MEDKINFLKTDGRSKENFMRGAAYEDKRLLYVTGSIDMTDTTIVMYADLPCAGPWTVIKAETNLTQNSWFAWQMRIGGDSKFPHETLEVNGSEQFKKSLYDSVDNRIVFYDGEVRPGEPVLKHFKVVIGPSCRLCLSHNRYTTLSMGSQKDEIPEIYRKGFGYEQPIVEVNVVIDRVSTHNYINNHNKGIFNTPTPMIGKRSG
jgi:hypothetical protein